MPSNLEKLRSLLQELFQLDQADLDFGIYRIMNQKRDEIVRFLDKDLLPQVQEAFKEYRPADKALIQQQLDEAVRQAQALGVDPDQSPKVQELRHKLADSAVDLTALENEVFSHLYNFFRRYYHEGDFISLRRYKEGVYAIPYEGEEVKLHWANADQYYVKSSEYFRDYIFTMPSGKRVRVHLVAASAEQDNKKEAPGKERRFIICEQDPIYEENGELFIRFEYRPDDGKKKQDALNQEAIDRVLGAHGFDEWIRELSKPAPTKVNPNRTVLEKHLTQYTARNTFDYFIHKDLGGFLRRELDFYIKNEVMHLDDVENESVPRVEQYLSKIRVIRKIAHKIVQFLEQLETFQKKLWLKKKFVIETNYCITLDRVPEELYPEIAANDAQREEWVRLFAIDKIKKDLNGPGYTKPLTVDFLKAHPNLLLDTGCFPRTFTDCLVASIDDLDARCDGHIFEGDNFHALELMQKRLGRCIDTIFIDPPYNTGFDGFVYKDSYQHGSWMSLVCDRLTLGRALLKDEGNLFVSIDDGESHRLRLVLEHVFGESNFVANVVWEKKYARQNDATWFSTSHDHVFVVARNKAVWRPNPLPRTEDQTKNYKNPDSDPRGPWQSVVYTCNKTAVERPNLYYGLTHPKTGEEVFPKRTRVWAYEPETHKRHVEENRLWWGVDQEKDKPRLKVFLSELKSGCVPRTIWYRSEAGDNQDAQRLLASLGFGAEFSTPKPIELVEMATRIGSSNEAIILDFFAGSGTTAHAVLSLNAASEKSSRKYVLVELEKYASTILKPRLQKAIYSTEWSDGVPKPNRGISHAFKYMRLESYDDALNNLEVKRTDQQTSLLEQDDNLREQYVLSYMLDVETRGSQSLLNVEEFRNPDEYKLRVERNGETQLVNVDLVETFNWLLGLTVKHIDVIRGVRVVDGTNPDGDRVLVLWRNLDETDNDALDQWFDKQGYSTRDLEYDLVYVNGDNNLENLRRPDQTWKVRLIEEEFHRLMFDVKDV